MTIIQMIGISLAGLVLGALVGYFARKRIIDGQRESVTEYSQRIINEANRKAKNIKKETVLKAKDTLYQMKIDFERETKEKKEILQAQEKRLYHKEEQLDKKIEQIDQKEKKVFKRERDLEQSAGEVHLVS